jgi:hypothetical protein
MVIPIIGSDSDGQGDPLVGHDSKAKDRFMLRSHTCASFVAKFAYPPVFALLCFKFAR